MTAAGFAAIGVLEWSGEAELFSPVLSEIVEFDRSTRGCRCVPASAERKVSKVTTKYSSDMSSGERTGECADVLFSGGWIYSGHDQVPHWGSLLLRNGKILSLDSAKLSRLDLQSAQTVDLAGRLVAPGFHDAHVHPIMAGIEMLGCDLTACANATETLAAIGAYASAHPELPWITGSGWSMDMFEGGTPARGILDALVSDRPVLLENRDHHSAWANTRAFKIAGIDESTPDPADGRIEREQNGYPAGTVHDGAIYLFDGVRPATDQDRAYEALLAAQARLLSYGITGWQDAALGTLMGLPAMIPVYTRALDEGTLLARVRGAQWWDRKAGLEQLEEMLAHANEVAQRYPRERFSLGSVKIMVDGVAESRTAAMHGYYRGVAGSETHNGMTFFESAELARYVAAIDAAGLQIHFHALGDRAVTDALDALSAARKANGQSKARHHLAHLEVVRAEDQPRFADLGAVANLQSLWAAHEAQLDTLVIPFLPDGAESRLYPFASLARAGARLALGSDWPVSSPDPLQAIHVGANRRHAHSQAAPLQADEALSLHQLLQASTHGSAYVNHLDDVCGRLERGMLGDLVILDKNLFELETENLHSVQVDETWIGGKRVYARA